MELVFELLSLKTDIRGAFSIVDSVAFVNCHTQKFLYLRDHEKSI